jgi:hypothetical protein
MLQHNWNSEWIVMLKHNLHTSPFFHQQASGGNRPGLV